MKRRFRRALAGALVAAIVGPGLPATRPRAPESLDASTIVRRAEQARAPLGDYAVEFTITVADDRAAGAPVRTASYSMLVHGVDRSIVLMRQPRPFFGGCLLIVSGHYWLLLPAADRPLELARDQVLRGDVAYGDLARSNLLSEYRPRLDGEERLDGEACFRIELAPTADRARYSRIVSWVSRKELLPRKLEFYGSARSLVRTAHYRGFSRTSVGVFPTRIEITSGVDPHQRSTLLFSQVRPADPSPVRFTSDGLLAFRRAALEPAGPDGPPPRLEEILERLSRARE